MRIFLIDFENVHSEGMLGVDHLTENDEVVIFYSNNADSITFDILHKLMFCRSKLSYYKIKRGGKNALDFQLSCYLGYRIHSDPEAEFYIISKDNGYDFIVDFWECGYARVEPKIRRFSNIKMLLQWVEVQKKQKEKALASLESLSKSEKKPIDVPNEKPTELSKVEAVSEETVKTAKSIMDGSKNTHEFYIGMVKHFGQKKGLEYYSLFKSDYQLMLKTRKAEIAEKAEES
jgi:hypothetical protein